MCCRHYRTKTDSRQRQLSQHQTSITCARWIPDTHFPSSILLLLVTKCPPCPIYWLHRCNNSRLPASTARKEALVLDIIIPEWAQSFVLWLLCFFTNTSCHFLPNCGRAKKKFWTAQLQGGGRHPSESQVCPGQLQVLVQTRNLQRSRFEFYKDENVLSFPNLLTRGKVNEFKDPL